MCKVVSTRFIPSDEMGDCCGWQIGDVPRHVSSRTVRSSSRSLRRELTPEAEQLLEVVTVGVDCMEEVL